MIPVDTFISQLVSKQFPDFYQEEGPLFVLFAEEYYKWLESTNVVVDGSDVAGETIYHSRNLLNYRDIDSTLEEFLIYFKEKYLKGISFDTLTNKRLLVKVALDLFRSKGTERSIDLLFKTVYGVKAEVFTPGDHILRLSDGKWIVPIYLELTRSEKTKDFIGKQVTGSQSGATAVIEYLITRNIKGNLIDIAYLSSIEGDFLKNDIINTSGSIEDCPKVIGSLTTVNLTLQGQGFEVGEEVMLTSARGVEGKARVTGIQSQTGTVQFILVDGGWGFSTTADTLVSSKVLTFDSILTTNIPLFTTIEQELYNTTLRNIIGEVSNGDILQDSGGNSAVIVSSIKAQYSNNALLIISPVSGNVLSSPSLEVEDKSVIVTNTSVVFNIGDTISQYPNASSNATGTVLDRRPVSIITISGSTSTSNGLAVGNYIYQTDTNASGYISATPKSSNYGFVNVGIIAVTNTVGTFNNTSVLTVYAESSNTTAISVATANSAELGYLYFLTNVTEQDQWTQGANVATSTSTNNTIKIVSAVGGTFSSFTNITATGNVIGSNTTSIGIIDVQNTFYGTGVSNASMVISNTTVTTPNIVSVSTGTGADYIVGVISDSETVLLSPDRISSNNDGPSTSSVKFSEMIISGANSTFGYLSDLLILNGGSGYSNSDVITFSGGTSGFSAGNATIVTDSSGIITGTALSANVGSGYTSTPTVTIANSSGGSSAGTGADIVPLFPLGFIKLPAGDLSFVLLDLLRFEAKTIGTISTLTGINPGENYNINPFILTYEPGVAAYDKKDYVLNVSSTNGVFVLDEIVQQTNELSTTTITGNNYSGNTSTFNISEYAYSTDGIFTIGSGTVRVSTSASGTHTVVLENTSGVFNNTIPASILTVVSTTGFANTDTVTQGAASGTITTLNSTTLVITGVSGTFNANATVITNGSTGTTTITNVSNTSIYRLTGLTSNSNINITDVDDTTTEVVTARGRVDSFNANILEVRRITLFAEFAANATNRITGVTSAANAVITSVSYANTLSVGLNANVQANVTTSTGSLTGIDIISSGFGYVQDEAINIVSRDGTRTATGKAVIRNQGREEGRYTSYDGFPDSYRYIHDGEYYQEYSYEVNTSIPFDRYKDLLREVLHVAGTKMFGKFNSDTTVNNTITVSRSSITY
jgi:hypothetical protein